MRTRHPNPIAAALAVLSALALAACGGSGQAGFTTGDRASIDILDPSSGLPSEQMAEETEPLVAEKFRDTFSYPDCKPAESLDDTGEFNFGCVAEDLQKGEYFNLRVVVFGTQSGEPRLGPVFEASCDPVSAEGKPLPRPC